MESDKAKKNLKRKMKKKRVITVKADIHKTNEDLDEIEPREETSEEDKQTKNRKRKRKINQDNNASNNGSNTDISIRDSFENLETSRSLERSKKAILMKKENEKIRLNYLLGCQKAASYLHLWKRRRHEWKLQELQQIWLMDHLLLSYYVGNEIFPVVLKYFKDGEDAARKSLVKTALQLMHRADLEMNEEHKRKILDSAPYQRARQLLKVLIQKDEIEKNPEIKSIFKKISNGSL